MRPGERPDPGAAPPPGATPAPAADEAPPVEIPYDGTLDLHTFRPAEVRDLLPEYLEGCHARGIRELRIVHGKGTGALRRTVEALLRRHPLVESFAPGGDAGGGWGATVVTLRAAAPPP
jgi:DNA-nicking Smr family endonuclease